METPAALVAAPRDGRLARSGSRKRAAVLIAIAVLVWGPSMLLRHGRELHDDGAFFLRYAENALHGQLWVWNPGEPPVWGASAPFYPLLIAVPMAFGAPAQGAAIGVGALCMLLALGVAALMLDRHVGGAAAGSFVLFAAFDSMTMYFATAGLETPLTLLLLALAVALLLGESGEDVAGVVAGLLLVHKVDVAPAGLLLLAAWAWQRGRFPRRGAAIATALALAWYGFAWIYFGSPLPNSFLTKLLHQGNQHRIIGWTWFGRVVLLHGIHAALLVLATFAILRQRRERGPLLAFLLGFLAIHLVAYSVEAPFEPYDWYTVPSVFCLMLLAALGVQSLWRRLPAWYPIRLPPARAHRRVIAALAIACALALPQEASTTRDLVRYAGNQERDRADAGRWVATHTPASFTVATSWGNPAFHSHRRVLDGSYLNRRYAKDDLIQRYRPQVLILQGDAGSKPFEASFSYAGHDGYELVEVFDRSWRRSIDFYVGVLVRRDSLHDVCTDVPPVSPMALVSDVRLGDELGRLRVSDQHTLYVHPGATLPTGFDLDPWPWACNRYGKEFVLRAAISPLVGDVEVARGGAVVGVIVRRGGHRLAAAVVTRAHPLQLKLTAESQRPLEIEVDSHGNPDTDWLLVSIE